MTRSNRWRTLPSNAASPEMSDSYRRSRREFYAEATDFWADTEGEEYALYQVHMLTPDEAKEIRDTADAIWHVYTRTATLLRTLPDEALLGLGLPPSTLSLARMTIPGVPETVIGRFDMLKTPQGYKMLELNADTPVFLYECFELNRRVCDEFGVQDVNVGEREHLAEALLKAIYASLLDMGTGPDASASVAFTSYGEDPEYRRTAEYLHDLVSLTSNIEKRFVSLEDLRIDHNGLYDAEGRRIDVLYRLYPIEFLTRDRDPNTGAPIGEMLFSLVLRKKLALINPPSAFLIQSKAVQAALWGLWEAGLHFDEDERVIIEKHLLPTYLDPVFNDTKYVIKPVYGREGDTVTIVDPTNHERCESVARSYAEQSVVYQQYVEMPQIELMTEQGPKSLPVLTCCFVIDGRASAIGYRIGGPITDAFCLFLPAGLGAG